jgi:hypothetical protein
MASKLWWQLRGNHNGTGTVFIQYRDAVGNPSVVLSRSLKLNFYPQQPSSARYRLESNVVAMNGTNMQSGRYRLSSTSGQALASGPPLQSSEYRAALGFWPRIPLSAPITPAPGPTLVRNGGFEVDANVDGRPDGWTSDARVTRATEVKNTGSYAMRHRATNNSSYAVQQIVPNLSGLTTYDVMGAVNIPTTSDVFTFQLNVVWRDAANRTLRTSVVRTYSTHTAGAWNKAAASIVAPAGTTNAVLTMQVTNLNATIYVDDVTFSVGNMLQNGGFETDANADTRPDVWSSGTHLTRDSTRFAVGRYSLRMRAANNGNYDISQVVPNIKAGKQYLVGAQFNIPATSDQFTVRLEVVWRNARNETLSTARVSTYTLTTNSAWDKGSATVKAPTGTTNALVRVLVTGLNGSIFVDDVVLRP